MEAARSWKCVEPPLTHVEEVEDPADVRVSDLLRQPDLAPQSGAPSRVLLRRGKDLACPARGRGPGIRRPCLLDRSVRGARTGRREPEAEEGGGAEIRGRSGSNPHWPRGIDQRRPAARARRVHWAGPAVTARYLLRRARPSVVSLDVRRLRRGSSVSAADRARLRGLRLFQSDLSKQRPRDDSSPGPHHRGSARMTSTTDIQGNYQIVYGGDDQHLPAFRAMPGAP